MTSISSLLGNRLLAAFPLDCYERLLPDLETVRLSPQQVLHPLGEPIDYVYFPVRSLISLTNLLSDGSILEVGLVGQAGMVGISVILGRTESVQQAVVQVGDRALRLPTHRLLAEVDRSPVLQSVLLRYVQALLLQTSQLAACHRFHSIRERLARQLLLIQDALEADEFPITHEALAQMFGTRRSGITVAAGDLSRMGIIRCSRGRVEVLQRQQLETTACECHRVIQTEMNRF